MMKHFSITDTKLSQDRNSIFTSQQTHTLLSFNGNKHITLKSEKYLDCFQNLQGCQMQTREVPNTVLLLLFVFHDHEGSYFFFFTEYLIF